MRRALFLLGALVLAGCGSHAAQTTDAGTGALAGARPIAIAGCEGVYYERPGRPRFLIVSDFPLDSSLRTAMHQMTQAIKLTLKDRDFLAGRYDVGYVVCNDSGLGGHYDPVRCVANARRIAALAKAVAVIGGVDSACARAQAAMLGAAHVAFVATLATADDLARQPLIRLSASRTSQALAAVLELARSGAHRVLLLRDGSPAGDAFARPFASLAAERGLEVVGRGRADGAYVAGSVLTRVAPLLRRARAAVGQGPVVVPETLGPASLLAAVAGSAAEGVELAVAGIPVGAAGPPGRAWVGRFEDELHAEPHPYAAYAAQAATLLLTAIARSDGSRASIDAQARRIGAADPLGRLHSPVTVFRVRDGGAEFVHSISAVQG